MSVLRDNGALPPGCGFGREIRFYTNDLTQEMQDWFVCVGGFVVTTSNVNQGKPSVKYGKGKMSYAMQTGCNEHIIKFDKHDSDVASMFLIKFMDQIITHNLKEAEHYEC